MTPSPKSLRESFEQIPSPIFAMGEGEGGVFASA